MPVCDILMYLKISQYAKQQGISYRTALRWFRYSLCARLYGQRRAKRKTEKLSRNWRPPMQVVARHLVKKMIPLCHP